MNDLQIHLLKYFSGFQYGFILVHQERSQTHKGRDMGASYVVFFYLHCDLHLKGMIILIVLLQFLFTYSFQAIQQIFVAAILLSGEKHEPKIEPKEDK